MSSTAPPTRRRAMLTLGAALGASPAAAAPPRKIVTLLGDSITAGYGLSAQDALPARLQAALRRRGSNVLVRGAGVSGDTTAAGLARVDFSVQSDTSLAVVALGGNDLLRGVAPSRVAANLDRIVSRLQARRIRVLVAGITAPQSAGVAYAREFNAVFANVAKRRGALLYPDLLAGVGGLPAFNQPDRVHPNAAGVQLIASRLAPLVASAIR